MLQGKRMLHIHNVNTDNINNCSTVSYAATDIKIAPVYFLQLLLLP